MRPLRQVFYAAAVIAILLGTASCSSSTPSSSGQLPVASETGGHRSNASAAPPLADQVAQQYGLTDLPSVTPIRTISDNDVQDVLDACIKEAGFPGLSGEVPDDQQEQWHLAIYRCAASYPIDPKYQMPLTKSQLEILYKYYQETLVPCLRNHGHNPLDPPSRETFLSSWGTSQAYSPYATIAREVAQMTQEDQNNLQKTCPQRPPNDTLYPTK